MYIYYSQYFFFLSNHSLYIYKSQVELVLSKDPVLRYQVGTKKVKTSRYQVSLSPGGTEYPVNPVLAAQMRSLHNSTDVPTSKGGNASN